MRTQQWLSPLMWLTVLSVLMGALLVLAAPSENQNKYTDKYDHVDIDMILRNSRILTSYIKCALDEGPCTAEGRQLKEDLPDALATDCTKCSPKQKEIVRKASRYVIQNRPKDWDRLQAKFDPESQYRETFDRFLKEDN